MKAEEKGMTHSRKGRGGVGGNKVKKGRRKSPVNKASLATGPYGEGKYPGK